jgi:hypothetical protein
MVRNAERLDWVQIRRQVLEGQSMVEVAIEHGTNRDRIAKRASREKWNITAAREMEKELARGEQVAQEIEMQLESFVRRLRRSNMRCRAELSEQVEETLRELREVPAVMRSRCLASLTAVCEKLFRWGEEPMMLDGRMGAINMRLIKTTPAQLNEMHAKAQATRENGGRGV